MSQSIYLEAGENLIELNEEPYDSEELLQRLLAKYPDLLAGSQIDAESPRKWLFIARESGVPGEQDGADRWALDHLFLDQDGIPTLVEVKRSSDTRIRREVVGQMLDYAANAVVYWPVERIRSLFEETCRAKQVDPQRTVQDFGAGEGDKFWQAVKTNIQARRIRMIFVADEIPPELRRIVEFLNEQMDPAEILAVEIKRFSGRGQSMYVPKVIGQTSEAETKKRPEGRQWDEESFFNALADRRGAAETQAARAIFDWAKENMSRIEFGRGQRSGSFIPIYDHGATAHYPIVCWTYGTIEVQFYWFSKPPFNSEDKRKELLSRLNAIEGVRLPADSITRRPGIPFSALNKTERLERFLETLQWYIEEVRKA
ncbi:MAG: hypothetical protein AB9869_04825 [Verrucomicrobiia bacterium]